MIKAPVKIILGRLYARVMYTRKYQGDALYYVSCDFGMGSASVKRDVLKRLRSLGLDLSFGQVILYY